MEFLQPPPRLAAEPELKVGSAGPHGVGTSVAGVWLCDFQGHFLSVTLLQSLPHIDTQRSCWMPSLWRRAGRAPHSLFIVWTPRHSPKLAHRPSSGSQRGPPTGSFWLITRRLASWHPLAHRHPPYPLTTPALYRRTRRQSRAQFQLASGSSLLRAAARDRYSIKSRWATSELLPLCLFTPAAQQSHPPPWPPPLLPSARPSANATRSSASPALPSSSRLSTLLAVPPPSGRM